MRITCKEHGIQFCPWPERWWGSGRGGSEGELTQKKLCICVALFLLLLRLGSSAVSYVWVVTVLELSFSPFVYTDS